MKNTIRKEYLEKRDSLSRKEIKEKSEAIIEKIINGEAYKNASVIFTYVAMGTEVSTIELIERAWSDKKRVAVPVTCPNRKMYFVEISAFDELKKSAYGVLEPQKGIELEVKPEKNDLFIVPGTVFDLNKNRYGYGGGYYDTYMWENSVYSTGIAFELQLAKKLPVEKSDKQLDEIITECRYIK